MGLGCELDDLLGKCEQEWLLLTICAVAVKSDVLYGRMKAASAITVCESCAIWNEARLAARKQFSQRLCLFTGLICFLEC